MGNTEALELGRILIDIPIEYRAVKELHITDRANDYGTLSLTLILPETAGEDVSKRLEGQSLRILTPGGEEIFAGICTGAYLAGENRYRELRVEARSHACVTDREPRSRTFQSPGKTLSQVARSVMGDYSVSLRLERDIPIEQMLSQQEETDWHFLRRVANQFGMLLFTDVKSPQIRIHIGVYPFSRGELKLEDTYEIKDIAGFWDVKQNVSKGASAYEFLQTGGITPDLTMGSGCLTERKGVPQIVTESEIRSERGILRNEVLLTYADGAVPASGAAQAGSGSGAGACTGRSAAPGSFTSVLTGKVTAVDGTLIQVEFDDGPGGVRWIPYTNPLGNDIYAMPDEGDEVFCYYDNSGEIVALGSKVKDNSYPDFVNPMERSLTAYNRMIKFREQGIDLTGSRSEYDGLGGSQVKITFSDTEGIDIAASGDIFITAAGTVLLQAKELTEEEAGPTEWFDGKFADNMEKFREQQQWGSLQYQLDKGKINFYDPTMDLLCTVGGNIVSGFWNDLTSPFQLIGTVYGLIKGEAKEPPLTTFASVEDKRVSLIALESLELVVGDTGMQIGKGYIMINASRFQQSGFNRKSDYPVMSESQRTGMDVFMDFVKLGVDIASMFCPALYALKVVSAGLSLLKGDYYGAISSLIPFSSVGALANGAAAAMELSAGTVKTIRLIKVGAEMLNAAINMGIAEQKLLQLWDKKGLAMLFELETWENALSFCQSGVSLYGSGKELDEILALPNTNPTPEGDTGKDNNGSGSDDDGSAGQQGNNGNENRKENTQGCGDPIDVVSGSQKITQTELVVEDVTGIFKLQRHYESVYKNSGSMLGERWFLNVGSYLSIQGDRATILLPDRHLERFRRVESGVWENLRGGDGSVTLTEKDREYLMYRKKEEKLYRYDFAGKLTAIEDRNKNAIHLKYMGASLVEMDFPSGQTISFRYEDNKLSCITDIIGREIRYQYEGELLTEVTYPNGGTMVYTYTPEGYIESVTDQNGNRFVRNEYSGDGRVTRQFVNENTEYVILYDDSNRVNTFLNMENNDRLEYHYNKDKLLVKTVYSDGSSEEIRYDERENKAWEKDRRGNELTRLFNEDSLLVEETLPNALSTWFEYDGEGRLRRQWDNAGRKQWYQYDKYGNPLEICREISDGVVQKVRFAYDSLGRILEAVDANGNVTSYSYEGKCPHPAIITTPEEDTFRYRYDRAGRCMEVVTEQGTTRYAYNYMNCRAMVTNPLGEITKYYYDGLCNLIKVVKPNQAGRNGSNAGMEYVYNALDEVVMTMDVLGNVCATPRDSEGNILKEISPNAYDPETGDGDGILYEYDVFNRRTKIRYPDGGVERIRYDAAGNIIQKISPSQYDEAADDGAGWSYKYDEVNRLVQITDPAGLVQKRYVYDLRGNIVKLITAKGYLMGESDDERVGELYCYNHMGWLTEARKPVKEEDGTVLYQLTQYRYDLAGNLVKELRYRDYQTADSEKGVVHTIAYKYDRNHRLMRVSDCTGAAVEYRYNSANRRTMERRKISDSVEQAFIYVYDGAGRLTEVRESADETGCGRKTSVTRYGYDHNGNLTRISLPYGAEIRREYDAADRLTAETHLEKKTGIHNTTRFAYDKAGNLTSVTDNLGRVIRSEYSLLNQETYRTEKDGGVTRSFYNLDGRIAKVIRPREYERAGEKGCGEQYAYDLSGRLLTVTRADGVVGEANTYDESGLIVRTIDGAGNGVRFTYDLGGRRIYAETDGGAGQKYEYDAFGNITGIVDGESSRTQYVLDEWGRIVEVKRADGVSEFYCYDYAGNVTQSVDGNGNATQYEYNCAGKPARMTDPMGYSEEYHYDLGNRLCRMRDRNGTEVSYTYNLYGNLLSRKAEELSESYEYTAEGLLKSAISQGMRYSYEYDAMGRPARKSASGRTLLSYTYDLNGNLTRQEDVTGKATEYCYNTLDLIEKVIDNGIVLSEYGYYSDGTIKNLKNGSLSTEYAYDVDRNLTGLRTTLGEQILADNHYLYDHNGNRTEKQQISGSTRYTYDALNQLARVEYPSYTEELFYDRAGNRSRRVVKGVEELYQYDPRNRLTEYRKGGMCTRFEYDNAGNLLADGRARYAYDAFNRTERVETFDGHVQVNRYDAEGLRHELEEDGKLVQFIYRGDEIVAEKTDDNIIRLIRGYDLTSSEADWARTYYHYASDEMGSITHVVTGQEKESAEGGEVPESSVLNHYEYDAWGNLTVCEETVPNRFKFNGQQYDPVSQQYYLRARFYNPVIARFTQEDTYRGDGLNLYEYCRNNPAYYVDPSGHNPNCVKEAAQKYMDEGLSPEDAYRRAYAEHAERKLADDNLTAQERYQLEQRLERISNGQDTNNILKIPVTLWTDAELQRAVDSIHNAQYGGKWWGNLCPMAVTVGPEGQVIVTKNGGPVRADSQAGQMAIQLFGSNVELPAGRGSNYWRIGGDTENRHAEARGIRAVINLVYPEYRNAAAGDVDVGSIRFGENGVGQVRQACSHYACGNPDTGAGCAGKISRHGIHNVTDFARDHNDKIGRGYVPNLWLLD